MKQTKVWWRKKKCLVSIKNIMLNRENYFLYLRKKKFGWTKYLNNYNKKRKLCLRSLCVCKKNSLLLDFIGFLIQYSTNLLSLYSWNVHMFVVYLIVCVTLVLVLGGWEIWCTLYVLFTIGVARKGSPYWMWACVVSALILQIFSSINELDSVWGIY